MNLNYSASLVELFAIQLPGHETRFNEILHTGMKVVVNELFEEFKFLLNKPFILFGHSLGALICFELIQRLQKNSLNLPHHLIVSGCRAPHLALNHKPIRDVVDPEFIIELIKYNGAPDYETYQSSEKSLLPFDITALAGNNDSLVSDKEIQGWGQYTSLNCNYFSIAGDHFFITSARSKVLSIIESIIEKIINKNTHDLKNIQ